MINSANGQSPVGSLHQQEPLQHPRHGIRVRQHLAATRCAADLRAREFGGTGEEDVVERLAGERTRRSLGVAEREQEAAAFANSRMSLRRSPLTSKANRQTRARDR